MTREEFDLWQLEQKLLEDLLGKIEASERKALEALGCPTDPRKVYILLNGAGALPHSTETGSKWPASITDEGKRAAQNAMFTLLHVEKVRRETRQLEGGSPRLAAHAALLAGQYASNSAFKAAFDTAWSGMKLEQSRKAGDARGAQQQEEAREHDDDIKASFQTWMSSETGLQIEHPHHVKFIYEDLKERKRIKIPHWKIRRRLRAMGLRARPKSREQQPG